MERFVSLPAIATHVFADQNRGRDPKLATVSFASQVVVVKVSLRRLLDTVCVSQRLVTPPKYHHQSGVCVHEARV